MLGIADSCNVSDIPPWDDNNHDRPDTVDVLQPWHSGPPDNYVQSGVNVDSYRGGMNQTLYLENDDDGYYDESYYDDSYQTGDYHYSARKSVS
jgi:hypothetical protein